MQKRIMMALLAALAVSTAFTLWISHRMTAAGAQAAALPKLRYAVAARPVAAGAPLQAADLKLVPWDVAAPLDGAATQVAGLIGRTVAVSLVQGEPVLDRMLAPAGSSAGLASRIPPGLRAISLHSDEVAGVAGFTQPGTRVDVLVTTHEGTSPVPFTTIVLQDVPVLTAGDKTQPDPEGKASPSGVVTLLVTPEEAARVVAATAQGIVHFLLRNNSDHQHVAAQGVTASAAGESSARAPAMAAALQPAERPGNPAAYGRSAVPSAATFGVASGASRSAERRVRGAGATSRDASPYTVQVINGTQQSLETFR